MEAKRSYRRWFVGVACALVGLVLVQGLLFWMAYEADFVRLDPTFRARLAVFLGVTVLSLVAFAGWILQRLFRAYVVPWHRLREDAEATLHGSPGAGGFSEPPGTPPGLGRALNALFERRQSEAARQEALAAPLRTEIAELEGVLGALGVGVVVAGPDRRIRRYNRRAGELLGDGHRLGAGRDVGAVADPALIDFALEAIAAQQAEAVPRPEVEFLGREAGAETLVYRVTPLAEMAPGWLAIVFHPIATPETPLAREAAPPVRPESEPGGAGGPLSDQRFVVFDTETTGLHPSQGDEIVSIGAVVVHTSGGGGRVVAGETFEQLVDPGRPCAPSAERIHGITAAMLAGRPKIEEVLPAFHRFARGSVLVAHNAAFDMRFLRLKEERAGVRFDHAVLDTMLLSEAIHPHQPSHSLDALIQRYGLAARGRHSALGDARMTAELLLALLPQLAERGIATVEEALAASARTPLARIMY